MANWTHHELGTFNYDYTGWAREMAFPAFKPFQYDWGGRRRARTKVRLEFDADDKDVDMIRFPSKRAIAVAQRTIKYQALLADRILNAMWRDIHGRGRDSGMWWHGDLRTIRERITDVYSTHVAKQLSVPQDLYDLLGVQKVLVRESTYLYEKPSATICFAAAFDDEHGVGILTDGTCVRGIGYQHDVAPFK